MAVYCPEKLQNNEELVFVEDFGDTNDLEHIIRFLHFMILLIKRLQPQLEKIF